MSDNERVSFILRERETAYCGFGFVVVIPLPLMLLSLGRLVDGGLLAVVGDIG